MSARFAPEHRFDGFVWLGSRGSNWVDRTKIPPSLLGPYDAAIADLDRNENDMDAKVRFLNASDRIADRVNPILDGPTLRAALASGDLRKRQFRIANKADDAAPKGEKIAPTNDDLRRRGFEAQQARLRPR
jgi:hypothetical protein